ncbi:tyrosine-type recombinase/integrase [Bifidobacterium aquikefiricola]|uniref:Site-specific integrase n=1 Tax=Bifidobacterium aquikefiricola TaxID=3059038 RepID=A0AB39U8C6_9BIFI
MARKSKRRAFGSVITRTNAHGKPYYEARYSPPVDAYARYAKLPERISKLFDDRTQAEAWLASEKRLIDLEQWEPPAERKAKKLQKQQQAMPFREYAAQWMEMKRKPDGTPLAQTTIDKKWEHLNNNLIPFFGDMPLNQITPRAVQEWGDRFDASRPHAKFNAYAILKQMMNDAATTPVNDIGETLIAISPCLMRLSKPGKQHKTAIISTEQLRQVANLMPERFRFAIWLGGCYGLRIGEVLALRRKDIDITNKVIHIRGSVKTVVNKDGEGTHVELGTTKTKGSERTVDMFPALAEMTAEHLRRYTGRGAEGLLFPAPHSDSPMRPNSLTETFIRARLRVPGLEKARFHDLRHNALSRLSEHGASRALIMQAGGHVTDIYSKYQDVTSATHKRQVLGTVDAELSQSIAVPSAAAGSASAQPTQSEAASSTGVADVSDVHVKDDADADGLREMAVVLDAMALGERVAVLRELDAARRAQVVRLLTTRVKTMVELLKNEV